ncbi:MAG: putative conjugal transfer protein [Anaerolineales bacterium]|nr:putative conjugal transfer protein [Anaerolineales bacterium]
MLETPTRHLSVDGRDGRDGYDYNALVTSVQDHLIKNEIFVPRWQREPREEETLAFHANVLRALKASGVRIAEEDRQAVAQEVAKRIMGMGVLQPFLEREGVEEIIVRDGFVQTERDGQIRDEGYLAPDEYFYRLARRIADLEGKELGAEEPQIKLGLPDGSRLTATIPPLSREGTAMNIRRFSIKRFTFDDLIERNACDAETAEFLAKVARTMSTSVVFSGRPGSGKTTFLNAFSQYIPPHAQVSCVETFHELQLAVPHLHHLVVEESEIVMGDAINTTILRMRPDILVIGEVVSTEAVQYIMSLNLGIVTHTTTHSHSAMLALKRLETLSRRSDIPLLERREIIGSGLSFVIHLAKEYDYERDNYRRHLQELMAIERVEGERYIAHVLKRWDPDTRSYTPFQEDPERWLKH